MVGPEQRRAPQQGECRENENDGSQSALHRLLMAARQQQQPQWQPRQGGQNQPSGVAQVNLLPILHDHNCGNCDRQQHRQRSGNLKRNAEGKQGHGDQRFAKSKRRSDQRREKNNGKNLKRDEIDSHSGVSP